MLTSAAAALSMLTAVAGIATADDLTTGSTPAAETRAALTPSSGSILQTIPLTGLAAAPPPGDRAPAARSGHLTVASTEQLQVRPFNLAAVTWRGDADVVAWVRLRTDGAWSQWYELPHGDDHAPDPGSAEAAAAAGRRAGTDPLLVTTADAVQVRVDTAGGASPQDLRLDLVRPDERARADAAMDVTAPAAYAAETGRIAARPGIRSRAQWGADESLRADPPDFGEVNGAFVHHTVSANNYAPADVPNMIRSIYTYHVRSRGWNDIGYNFIVDRFGTIWEGRYGGVERAVIGAHTAGYNDDAFAASALGTYSNNVPSDAVLVAYERLFAWKFRLHGVDPRYAVRYDGEWWPAVAGHRDAAATECPGDELYARLGRIRAGVAAFMGLSPSRSLDSVTAPDLVARRTNGTLWFYPGSPAGGYRSSRQLGVGWDTMATVVLPGDWDRDGNDDVIATRRSDGTLWLYSGNGAAGFLATRRIGVGFDTVDMVTAVGDWNGDGLPDLLARKRSDKTLWLYPGRADGGVGSARRIGSGWQIMNMLVGPGDWDGDGKVDLLARGLDGRLWLYPGTGTGAFGAVRAIGSGWRGARVAGAGDVNRDGRPDLVAVFPDGVARIYTGNGSGSFSGSSVLASGWSIFDWLA
ncbi:FG-GAP-like repeat-containing protein [Jiangella mangrovi]|uniref:Peptidoglycan recognition protein family domain-containing protein n=1 Tax=Jiangella mangrovi TaxID=1524084 RepID=A0A7W9GQZ0_9ACTN|nr:hypothetical protein [Jiangella mangrovi]